MDNESRRSLSKNERISRITTNGNHTNPRRNLDNVPHSLRRKHKHSIDGREREEVLARPEKSGHIAKWAIKLGEHEIEFRGHSLIKEQILADFLAETPSTRDKEIPAKEAKRKEPEPKSA
ncbi:hypothetical protein Tco_0241352 [Tanacetum coccineum]